MLAIETELGVRLPAEAEGKTDWNRVMALHLMFLGMQRLDADSLPEFQARLAVIEKLSGPLTELEGGLPEAVVVAYAAARTRVNATLLTRAEFLRIATSDLFIGADVANSVAAARKAAARRQKAVRRIS